MKINLSNSKAVPVILNDEFDWEDMPEIILESKLNGFTFDFKEFLKINSSILMNEMIGLAEELKEKHLLNNACISIQGSSNVCTSVDESLVCKMDFLKTKVLVSNKAECPEGMEKVLN